MKYEHKNRTVDEAKKYYGEKLTEAMLSCGVLDGSTCTVNEEGKLIIYGIDWENAYHYVKIGRTLFWD